MKTISVIVPVYNAEKYLRQCIESIINSTYKELEIILVNDGSKDASESICKEYVLKDSRIQVINQCNKGLPAARNAGLDRAEGKYISFVDADDAITQDFFEKMVYAIETTGADWSACDFFVHKKNNLEKQKTEITEVEGISNQIAAVTVAPKMRNLTWINGYVWNKLYLRSKINFRFSEKQLMGEDLEFNYNYCKLAAKVAIIDEALYFYRQSDSSIMGTYRGKKEINKGISNAKLWMKIAEDSKDYEVDLKEYLEGRAAYMVHGALWRIYACGENKLKREFVENFRKYIKLHWKETWKDRDTYSLKIRGAVLVNRFCFPIWVVLVNVIK